MYKRQGDVISNIIAGVIPAGNPVIGVIVYVLGMVIFTMIMGNAFAAFTVITISIGSVSYTHLDVYKRQVQNHDLARNRKLELPVQ